MGDGDDRFRLLILKPPKLVAGKWEVRVHAASSPDMVRRFTEKVDADLCYAAASVYLTRAGKEVH